MRDLQLRHFNSDNFTKYYLINILLVPTIINDHLIYLVNFLLVFVCSLLILLEDRLRFVFVLVRSYQIYFIFSFKNLNTPYSFGSYPVS